MFQMQVRLKKHKNLEAYLLSKRLFVSALLICLFSGTASAETVWIDVRSSSERFLSKIEGDEHIPYREIVEGVNQLGLTKDTEIAIYCAAGVRAEKARKALLEAGYNNVVNQGGLSDVKALRGLD